MFYIHQQINRIKICWWIKFNRMIVDRPQMIVHNRLQSNYNEIIQWSLYQLWFNIIIRYGEMITKFIIGCLFWYNISIIQRKYSMLSFTLSSYLLRLKITPWIQSLIPLQLYFIIPKHQAEILHQMTTSMKW